MLWEFLHRIGPLNSWKHLSSFSCWQGHFPTNLWGTSLEVGKAWMLWYSPRNGVTNQLISGPSPGTVPECQTHSSAVPGLRLPIKWLVVPALVPYQSVPAFLASPDVPLGSLRHISGRRNTLPVVPPIDFCRTKGDMFHSMKGISCAGTQPVYFIWQHLFVAFMFSHAAVKEMNHPMRSHKIIPSEQFLVLIFHLYLYQSPWRYIRAKETGPALLNPQRPKHQIT